MPVRKTILHVDCRFREPARERVGDGRGGVEMCVVADVEAQAARLCIQSASHSCTYSMRTYLLLDRLRNDMGKIVSFPYRAHDTFGFSYPLLLPFLRSHVVELVFWM